MERLTVQHGSSCRRRPGGWQEEGGDEIRDGSPDYERKKSCRCVL